MFLQVIAVSSLIALANAGYLLGGSVGVGGGLGGGLGGGFGNGGIGIAIGGISGGYGGGYGGNRGYGGYGARAVDYYAPPHYEYNYGVHDPHTYDFKQKVESRVGGRTSTQYAWGEKDRQVQEARLFINH